eukprot:m.102414 g.102414  ORF g.102414 m.102414 type:complete len:1182 (+) comp13774_c0_seq1:133-3678(+)
MESEQHAAEDSKMNTVVHDSLNHGTLPESDASKPLHNSNLSCEQDYVLANSTEPLQSSESPIALLNSFPDEQELILTNNTTNDNSPLPTPPEQSTPERASAEGDSHTLKPSPLQMYAFGADLRSQLEALTESTDTDSDIDNVQNLPNQGFDVEDHVPRVELHEDVRSHPEKSPVAENVAGERVNLVDSNLFDDGSESSEGSEENNIPEEGLSSVDLASMLVADSMHLHLSHRAARHLSFSSSDTEDILMAREMARRGQMFDVYIYGCAGYTAMMNGGYTTVENMTLCGRKVYKKGKETCEDTSDDLLFFFAENYKGWVVAQHVTEEPIAYIEGDVMNQENKQEGFTWKINDLKGNFCKDSNIGLRGKEVPAHICEYFGVDASVGETSESEDDRIEDSYVVVDQQDASSAMSSQEPLKPSTSSDSTESHDDGSKYDINRQEKASLPGEPNKTKRRQSLRERMSRKAKSVRRATKKVAGRLLGLRAMPSEVIMKAAEKLRVERNFESKVLHGMTLQKLVRTPKNAKDSLEKLRGSLLTAWNVALEEIEMKHRTTGSADLINQDPDVFLYLDIFYDTVIAVMVREELFLSDIQNAHSTEPFVRHAVALHLRTHAFVARTLGTFASGELRLDAKEHESVVLFCAKALAINYFCIPRLAQTIVVAISRATPIGSSRRSRKIGSNVMTYTSKNQEELHKFLPLSQKVLFANLFSICQVNVTRQHQHRDVNHKPHIAKIIESSTIRMPGATLETPRESVKLLNSFVDQAKAEESFLVVEKIWPRNETSLEALGGPWTDCFVTETDAGFGLLSIFVEVLFRRSRSLYTYNSFRKKSDSKLGINEQQIHAATFMPGFPELITCFLRNALFSEYALKRLFRVGAGPPSLVCNWTDRTAACSLALSQHSAFLSCLLRDLMEQTSITHVADVMALLGSLKALFESYQKMHNTTLPNDLDISLITQFLKQLISCKHYVVLMFTIRWLYDCIDYFSIQHRLIIIDLVLSRDVIVLPFCHWEPSVRNLIHTFLLFRMYDPTSIWQQNTMINQISAHLNSKQYVPVPPDRYTPRDAPPLIAQHQRNQLHEFQSFISIIVNQHRDAERYGTDTVQAKSEAPAWAVSRYAAESLNQLKSSVVEASAWLKEHRKSSKTGTQGENQYPPLVLSMPPLQNMTSAYIKGRMRKSVPQLSSSSA